MATQLLGCLAHAGMEIDCFVSVAPPQLPPVLTALPNVNVVSRASGWEYDRWYSSHPMSKTLTGLGARALGQVRLAEDVARRHRCSPYALVYQFSHIETVALSRVRRRLPPLVVHPEVHMAGELAWHTRERWLSRRCEPTRDWLASQALLRLRASLQRHDARAVDGWIVPSRRFADLLARDYELPRGRISVVPNPIDLGRFRPSDGARRPGPVRLLFVSRMAVRKGVEMLVAVSHRLRDLDGRVHIEAVGGPTLWSDYTPLLRGLNAAVSRYAGGASPAEVAALMRDADALLQPSHYEPFALTVGEAVASGTPVIVSSDVGAGEFLSSRSCRRFPTGDLNQFEQAIRSLVSEVEGGDASPARIAARQEAHEQFGRDAVAERLTLSLARFA